MDAQERDGDSTIEPSGHDGEADGVSTGDPSEPDDATATEQETSAELEEAGADDDPFGGLSFDRADVDVALTTCAGCGASIHDEYYEADSRVVCTACARTIRYGAPGDSALARTARALGLGVVAAFFSGLVWWGIREATGYEIGLIAIAVGLAVGIAVRKGSRAMGGWFYQTMAIALTYASIVGTYVPALMDGIMYPDSVEETSESAGVPPPTEARGEPAVPAALAFVVACIFAPATPFFMGLENIIGLALIAFALWEAWRVNKRAVKSLAGPYALARDRAAA